MQQAVFLLLLAVTTWLVYRRVVVIRKTIALGREENLRDQPGKRLAMMLRIAFGQKRMFDRPVVGFLHFLVYAGFLLINIEVAEIVLDGLTGSHRLFTSFMGSLYAPLIGFFELLAIGVMIACAVFLFRRHLLKTRRLQPALHREMKGWPALDATIILCTEIVLMIAILSMNAADQVLQQRGHVHYPLTGNLLFSQFLTPLFTNWETGSLVIYERVAWWFHIAGIFAFAVYITYSKHLHIVLAFPNTYFTRLQPLGKMRNMPEITKEVQLMLGLPVEHEEGETNVQEQFGAKDVQDLSWKSLLDAYTCTECGRCTSVCPANMTGKLLSPRKIMTDTRDRLEDIGRQIQTKGAPADDGKSLLGDYIKEEELLACTSCNACVQECPVLINPLSIILELRRYQIMDKAQAPNSWNMMFQNMETSQAPWKFSPGDRFNWVKELNK